MQKKSECRKIQLFLSKTSIQKVLQENQFYRNKVLFPLEKRAFLCPKMQKQYFYIQKQPFCMQNQCFYHTPKPPLFTPF